jgi:hypothetical protein
MSIIVILLITGVVMYLVPMPEKIQKLIYVVLVVLLLIWLLGMFGLLPATVRLP